MNLEFPLKAVFIALPLQEDAKQKYQELQKSLSEFGDSLIFQNADSPHLTLHYWSEVLEIEFHQITQQLEKIAESVSPLSLKVRGVNTFGYRGKDHVLFLDVPFSEELAKLKKKCPWPSLDRTGHEIPNKPFHPHITLARIKHPERFATHKKKILKILGMPEFSMDVKCLRLYAEIQQKKQTPVQDFYLH